MERARQGLLAQGKTLVYERTGDGDKYLPLMISPEQGRRPRGDHGGRPFVIANSMREVQPEINLLVCPIPEEALRSMPADGAPDWTLPAGGRGLMTDDH